MALQRGRPQAAARLFRTASAALTGFDLAFLPQVRAMVALAEAGCGHVAEAEAALTLPEGTPTLAVYEPDRRRSEAAVFAARGQRTQAAEQSGLTAEVAAAREQWGVALVAAHDAARYGAPKIVLPLARELARRVDGPLAWCRLDHVVALCGADGPGLDEVSRRFERLGTLLLAAEAAGDAARAHTRAQDPRAATAAGKRARALLERCPGADAGGSAPRPRGPR